MDMIGNTVHIQCDHRKILRPKVDTVLKLHLIYRNTYHLPNTIIIIIICSILLTPLTDISTSLQSLIFILISFYCEM